MNQLPGRIRAPSAFIAVCIAMTGGLYTTTAPAQDAELVIEELVVTARKREESLQEVPISISAFTQENLQALNIRSTDDIAMFTPGLSFTSAFGRQPGSDRPTMRGITTILNGVGNAGAAATFIDGVYVGGSTQFTAFENIERIEVLKGPQAAQFGRGTYAGAINYITRQPTDELEGGAKATVGEHSTFEASGWVSGPLAEGKAYFSLGASHSEYGGEWTNTRDGETVGGEETDSWQAKLRLTPTDDLEINLRIAGEETDDEHFAIALFGRENNNCCERSVDFPRAREYYRGTISAPNTVNLYGTDLFNGAGAGDPGTRVERIMASLDVRWDFADGYELAVVTGMISDDIESRHDVSYAGYDALSNIPRGIPPLPFLLFTRELLCNILCGNFQRIVDEDQNDKSFELRVSSPSDRSVRWTGGIYYYDGDASEKRNERIIPPEIFAEFSSGFGMLNAPYEVKTNGAMTAEDIENIGVFGGVEFDINDQWSASVEARWSEDDISVTNYNNLGGRNRGTVVVANGIAETFSSTFDSFTPRVTLRYAPNDDSNYFVSIATGTKPGNFNADVPMDPATGAPLENFRNVDEETATTLEVGYKTSLMNGRATLNAAAYFTQVEDQQLTNVIELASGSTASILQNVGESEVFGVELEYNMLISENLFFAATYAYTNSEYTQNISSDQADLNGSRGTFSDIQALGSVAGQTQPRSPEHMASVFARWDRELASGRTFFVSGNAAYESSKFAQEHNLAETGDRTLVGLNIGLESENWDLRLWVKNLFDDDTPVDILRYIDRRTGSLISVPSEVDPVTGEFIPNSTGASSSPRGFGASLQRGRQIGATVSYRF